MMGPIGPFGLAVPFLFGLIWLGVVIYLVVLATRFVQAVEKIADEWRRGLRDRTTRGG